MEPFTDRTALAALDDLPLGVWVGRVPSGDPVYVNRAFRQILGMGMTAGLTVEEMAAAYGVFDRAGRPYPPEHLPFHRALASGRPVVLDDIVIHRRDGQQVYLRIHATPIGDVAGQPGHVVVAFSDITLEAQAREARDSVEKQLTFAINYAPVVLWMHDREGRISLSEGAALRALGLAPGELVGQSVFDIYREQPEILANIARALDGESLQDLFTKDGKVSFHSHLAPTFGPGGEVTGVIGLATDVTETRQLEERLVHAEKMEAVGRLAGGIAHDFNNLLGAIQGFAFLCHQRHPPGHQTRDDAEQILRSCQRGELLIKQLLAFSRKQSVRPEVVELSALVLDLERTLRRLISQNIVIDTALAPDAGHVNADVAQLENLLINLVVNSRDAMPDGGRLKIEVSGVTLDEAYARQHPEVVEGRYVLLAVTDTGVGMSQETKERMFEPFFTTKESGRGTGLGLASVYGIVKQSHGHLAVSSEPGQGTTMRVYLPWVAPPSPAAQAKPARPLALHGVETVLVVEDHEMLRQFSCQVLRHHGYQVLETGQPRAAIDLCKDHPRDIHLMLTDVVLPGMNGFDLASRARRLRPTMPVLFMSGHAAEVMNRGPDQVVLEKPFAPQALLTQIRRLLDGAQVT